MNADPQLAEQGRIFPRDPTEANPGKGNACHASLPRRGTSNASGALDRACRLFARVGPQLTKAVFPLLTTSFAKAAVPSFFPFFIFENDEIFIDWYELRRASCPSIVGLYSCSPQDTIKSQEVSSEVIRLRVVYVSFLFILVSGMSPPELELNSEVALGRVLFSLFEMATQVLIRCCKQLRSDI